MTTEQKATPEQAQEWAHHSVRVGVEAPWYPPVPAGFGPPVEWIGGDSPVAEECEGYVLFRCDREDRMERWRLGIGPSLRWSHIGNKVDIVAYCLATHAEPQQAAAPQPAQEQADPNAAMIFRDGDPAPKPSPAAITPAPAFMLPDHSALLVVAPMKGMRS